MIYRYAELTVRAAQNLRGETRWHEQFLRMEPAYPVAFKAILEWHSDCIGQLKQHEVSLLPVRLHFETENRNSKKL